MKTKSHWISTYPLNRYDLGDVIEQIQLDAMREGMRRAAKVSEHLASDADKRGQIEKADHYMWVCGAILSAAEELNEKDLE